MFVLVVGTHLFMIHYHPVAFTARSIIQSLIFDTSDNVVNILDIAVCESADPQKYDHRKCLGTRKSTLVKEH